MSTEGSTDQTNEPRAADAYEQKYMAARGTVLRREKAVWKLHWLLLFAPLVTLLVAGLGFAGVGSKPMPLPVAFALLPMAALLFALWAAFITLRVTVTTREIVVQYGLFGPRIPIDSIESCVVKDIPALAFAGGIKRVDGAWAYTLYGHGTRVVRIKWRSAAGKKCATILSSNDPDAFAELVERARTVASTKVRVRAEVSREDTAEEEAPIEGEERLRRR